MILYHHYCVILQVSQRMITLEQLLPGTSYVIKVRAFTNAGFGPFSQTAQYATKDFEPTTAPFSVRGFGTLEIIIACAAAIVLMIIIVALLLVRKKREKKRKEALRVRSKLAGGESTVGLLEQGLIQSTTPGLLDLFFFFLPLLTYADSSAIKTSLAM